MNTLEEKIQSLDCGTKSSPEKNIYNKIGLVFYAAEKRFKDAGIDSKKFGIDELREDVFAVIQKQFNLD